MVRWGQTGLTIYPKITVLSSCTKQLRQSLISSTNYQNKNFLLPDLLYIWCQLFDGANYR